MNVIGKFTKLKELDLQHTRVTDAGVRKLKPLRLKWLALDGDAGVTGTGSLNWLT